jgi:hypothetical protein
VPCNEGQSVLVDVANENVGKAYSPVDSCGGVEAYFIKEWRLSNPQTLYLRHLNLDTSTRATRWTKSRSTHTLDWPSPPSLELPGWIFVASVTSKPGGRLVTGDECTLMTFCKSD